MLPDPTTTLPSGPDPRRRPRTDRPALAAWTVVWRCVLLLSVLAVVLTLVAGVVGGVGVEAVEAVEGMAILWTVHVSATVVVGYPVGLLTTRLLPEDPSRARAAAAYAVAGAVSGWLVVLAVDSVIDLGTPWFGVYGAALGAAVAGLARAWAHDTIARRAAAR